MTVEQLNLLIVATATFLGIVAGIVLLLVNILFAVGVMRDADRIREKGGDVVFVGPGSWAFGVLIGSFLVVALYWLTHHSTLRRHESTAQA